MEFAVESLETPALTKAQLAELLFEQIGLNKRESKDMIDAFFDLISASLVDGSDVKISGFGNFQIRTKAPRPGRNPRTGEAIPIRARRVVTFHASPKARSPLKPLRPLWVAFGWGSGDKVAGTLSQKSYIFVSRE
jgi:integration host factor subunit alpha